MPHPVGPAKMHTEKPVGEGGSCLCEPPLFDRIITLTSLIHKVDLAAFRVLPRHLIGFSASGFYALAGRFVTPSVSFRVGSSLDMASASDRGSADIG